MKLNTTEPILKFKREQKDTGDSLSAAVFIDDHLWVASDELASVERLSSDDGSMFEHHKSFPLEEFIRLPALGTEFDQEVDIEGLDYNGSYLWLVGSHSIKRKNVAKEDSGSIEKKIRKLAKTEIEGNRFILARIPVVFDGDSGKPELKGSAKDATDGDRVLTTAQLAGDEKSNELTEAIRAVDQGHGDVHLGKFLSVPGKDNGFDIEGLAVVGDRVFMGLRGPVLRGFSVVLEVTVDFANPSRLILKDVGPDGRSYKKHFLDLGGLGIRDLCLAGSDMLILAGPTMNLDGPVAIFRWVDAVKATEKGESLIFSDELKHLVNIPYGEGTDHAEAMTLIPGGKKRRHVLIVYDSPSKKRKAGVSAVRADVFELPGL